MRDLPRCQLIFSSVLPPLFFRQDRKESLKGIKSVSIKRSGQKKDGSIHFRHQMGWSLKLHACVCWDLLFVGLLLSFSFTLISRLNNRKPHFTRSNCNFWLCSFFCPCGWQAKNLTQKVQFKCSLMHASNDVLNSIRFNMKHEKYTILYQSGLLYAFLSSEPKTNSYAKDTKRGEGLKLNSYNPIASWSNLHLLCIALLKKNTEYYSITCIW